MGHSGLQFALCRPARAIALPRSATPDYCPGLSVERVFVVPFGGVDAEPKVDPHRLIGAQRCDVLCRCIVAACLVLRRLRRDTTFIGALAKPSWTTRIGQAMLDSLDGMLPAEAGPTGVLTVRGAELDMLSSDEQYVGLMLAQVLADCGSAGKPSMAAKKELGQLQGWSHHKVASLRELLEGVLGEGPSAALPPPSPPRGTTRLLVLREDAPRSARSELELARADGVDRLVFVLGDHVGLRPIALGRLVTEFGGRAVTLGETHLLTSQCISVLQFLVDSTWSAKTSPLRGSP